MYAHVSCTKIYVIYIFLLDNGTLSLHYVKHQSSRFIITLDVPVWRNVFSRRGLWVGWRITLVEEMQENTVVVFLIYELVHILLEFIVDINWFYSFHKASQLSLIFVGFFGEKVRGQNKMQVILYLAYFVYPLPASHFNPNPVSFIMLYAVIWL